MPSKSSSARTKPIISGGTNPHFSPKKNSQLFIVLAKGDHTLEFAIWNKNTFMDDRIGLCEISVFDDRITIGTRTRFRLSPIGVLDATIAHFPFRADASPSAPALTAAEPENKELNWNCSVFANHLKGRAVAVTIHSARDLQEKSWFFGFQDPYVVATVLPSRRFSARTQYVLNGGTSPQFTGAHNNQLFLPLEEEDHAIELTVWNANVIFDDELGTTQISLSFDAMNTAKRGWFVVKGGETSDNPSLLEVTVRHLDNQSGNPLANSFSPTFSNIQVDYEKDAPAPMYVNKDSKKTGWSLDEVLSLDEMMDASLQHAPTSKRGLGTNSVSVQALSHLLQANTDNFHANGEHCAFIQPGIQQHSAVVDKDTHRTAVKDQVLQEFNNAATVIQAHVRGQRVRDWIAQLYARLPPLKIDMKANESKPNKEPDIDLIRLDVPNFVCSIPGKNISSEEEHAYFEEAEKETQIYIQKAKAIADGALERAEREAEKIVQDAHDQAKKIMSCQTPENLTQLGINNQTQQMELATVAPPIEHREGETQAIGHETAIKLHSISSEMLDWLEIHNLSIFADRLESAKIYSLTTLSNSSDKTLEAIGLKRLQIKRLRRSLTQHAEQN